MDDDASVRHEPSAGREAGLQTEPAVGQTAPAPDPLSAADRSAERTPRAGAVVVIVVFALLLLWPAALALAGRAGTDGDFIYHSEMRNAFVAPPPSSGALATGGWERDLERQIADGFPLRRRLIEGYDVAKYLWLGDVASSHVVRGGDGWLFYGDEERSYLDGSYHPTDAELERLAGVYQARADWCARRGIAYVFAFVPNKSTVYTRFLPDSVRVATPTAAERLLPLIAARGVRVVDTRRPLLAAAEHGEVYSKGETHWNDAGAYVAYREIVAALRGARVRDTIAPASLRPRIALEDGDLDRLAGITSAVHDEVVVYDFPRRAHEVAAPGYRGDPIQGAFIRAAFETGDPRLPKGMLFGDSFTLALRPFLAEDFSRLVVMQHSIPNALQFDRTAIEAEKPGVVIQELIERALVYSDRFQR
ncbi:MAG TPA: hypothetical protein VGD01_19245 [Candidatus Elarobacter sp.]|jgi:hypothetical protein